MSPYVTSGAVYDPNTHTWADASCSLANCQRNYGSVILDEGYIRIWGGGGGSAPSGLEYSVSGGSWAAWTPESGFPSAYGMPADDGRRLYFPNGGCSSSIEILIFDRQTQSSTTDAQSSPAGLASGGSIAWTGSEVVLWSQTCGSSTSSVGGRYQPPAPE